MSKRVALIASIVGIVAIASPVGAASAFQGRELVASGFHEASMVLVGGRPHIAAVGDRGIWHFTRQNGVWLREKLTHFTGNPNQPTHGQPQIAVDPTDGSLTVVFERLVPQNIIGGCGVIGLRYVTNRTGEWTDNPGRVGDDDASSQCMLDPSVQVLGGHLYVAGAVGTVPAPNQPQRVRYLTNVTGDWTFDDVVGSSAVSLALDSHGNPLMAGQRYRKVGDEDFDWTVWLSRGTSPVGNFVRERVANVDELGATASLALSGTDLPRVTWSELTGESGVKYAFRNNSGWHEDDIAGGLASTDLVIDPFGMAHISATGFGRLWYLTGPQNGGSFDFAQYAVTAPSGVEDADIDVAANGQVHIEFERNGDVWWVRSQL